MGRTRGSTNKPKQPPEALLSAEEKLQIIADIIVEATLDELEGSACKTQ